MGPRADHRIPVEPARMTTVGTHVEARRAACKCRPRQRSKDVVSTFSPEVCYEISHESQSCDLSISLICVNLRCRRHVLRVPNGENGDRHECSQTSTTDPGSSRSY